MKRKKPSFNESYHGYRTFSDLLEDAEKEGIIQLRTDSRSGTYVIVGFGKEQKKGEEEESKVLKERKTQKSRTTQKPHWRPRQRRQKTQTSATTTVALEPPFPSEPVAPETNTSEREPVT
jgi:hypothetical protein